MVSLSLITVQKIQVLSDAGMCLNPLPQWPPGSILDAWTMVTPFWFLSDLKYVIKFYPLLLANSFFKPQLRHSLLLQETFSDMLLFFGWVFSGSRNNAGAKGNMAWEAPCCGGQSTGESVKRTKFPPWSLPLRKLWDLREVPSPLGGVSRSAYWIREQDYINGFKTMSFRVQGLQRQGPGKEQKEGKTTPGSHLLIPFRSY